MLGVVVCTTRTLLLLLAQEPMMMMDVQPMMYEYCSNYGQPKSKPTPPAQLDQCIFYNATTII